MVSKFAEYWFKIISRTVTVSLVYYCFFYMLGFSCLNASVDYVGIVGIDFFPLYSLRYMYSSLQLKFLKLHFTAVFPFSFIYILP